MIPLKHITSSLILFKKMNSVKMIPEVIYSIGEILYQQKDYQASIDMLMRGLEKSKEIRSCDSHILILKKLKETIKKIQLEVILTTADKVLQQFIFYNKC